eukprot:462336-Rhodomonas_salina.1
MLAHVPYGPTQPRARSLRLNLKLGRLPVPRRLSGHVLGLRRVASVGAEAVSQGTGPGRRVRRQSQMESEVVRGGPRVTFKLPAPGEWEGWGRK